MKAACVATLVLLLAGAAGCGGGEPGGLPGGRAAIARTSLTPPVHLFAEPVVARVDVTVDPRKVDPSRVRLTTDFRPYEVMRLEKTRQTMSGLTRIRYAFTLRCLLIQCIPSVLSSAAGEAESGRSDRVTFDFGRARVLDRTGRGKPRVVASARWPKLESISRINAASVPSFGFVFKTNVTPLPPATYRIAPALLAGLLVAGAVVLLALPATLVWLWWRRRRPAPVEEEPEESPLERALRLVAWASVDGDAVTRREALELLAHELDEEVGDGHVRDARRLAWSSAPPDREETEALVDAVRKETARDS